MMSWSLEQGRLLLAEARRHLTEALGEEAAAVDFGEPQQWLSEPGATFVTLRRARDLYGCIGTVRPIRPLLEDVRFNTLRAAFHDPRTPDMTPELLPEVKIEISVLSPLEPLAVDSAEELCRCLRPCRDGVFLSWEGRHATFLPQVWSELPDPVDFLQQLRLKMGVAADFWNRGLQVERYSVVSWQEP